MVILNVKLVVKCIRLVIEMSEIALTGRGPKFQSKVLSFPLKTSCNFQGIFIVIFSLLSVLF